MPPCSRSNGKAEVRRQEKPSRSRRVPRRESAHEPNARRRHAEQREPKASEDVPRLLAKRRAPERVADKGYIFCRDDRRSPYPRESTMAKPKKWVRNVKTVSTDPPKDLFTKDAQTIAKTMAKKSVSPKGIGSGIRMIQYFINRAGKNLSMTRKRQLEKAKTILQKKKRT
jgi:Protein of unknown function (DUF3175)